MSGPDIGFWLDMMSDEITINPWVSKTSAHGNVYSPDGVSYPAYIEMKNHIVLNNLGEEVVARGRVFVGSHVVAGTKDLLTLPAEYTPRTPPIISVNVVNDESGNHHTVLEIG
jgi:hypothetical protein